MNISCEIIRDLLPLYVDEVCSGDSRDLVENHLAGCENCRAELNDMKDDLPQQKVIAEEADSLKAARKAQNRSTVKGIMCTLVVVLFLIAVGVFLCHPDVAFPVEPSRMQVEAACQLENGNIYFMWSMKDGSLGERTRAYREKDGAMYVIPLGPLIELHSMFWHNIPDSYEKGVKIIHPDSTWSDRYGESHEGMNAIYLGWGEDAILIWEEGMELPEMSKIERDNYEAWYHARNEGYVEYDGHVDYDVTW